MPRSIVGWVHISDEPWSDTMHRMKQRMDRAAAMHFVQPWSIRLLRNQWSFAHHLSTLDFSSWRSLTLHWIPNLVDDFSLPYTPFRSAGRPQTRWDDNLATFSAQLIVNTHWIHSIQQLQGSAQLLALRNAAHMYADAYVVHSLPSTS